MKSLHIAMTALGAVFLSLGAPPAAQAQFRTAPIIDGVSSLAEYGNEYKSPNGGDPNLLWRITWDDTNLYVAIEDANLQEGAAIYIDLDPQLVVNAPGGNQQKGFNRYLNTNGNLPIQADLVIYAEKFYHEYRFYNKENGTWGSRQEWALKGSENIGRYADNATGEETETIEDDDKWSRDTPERNFSGTVKEFSLPWSRIGVLTATGERKRPEDFNWFGQIHYAYDPINGQPNPNAGGIYGQVPRENERGDRRNGALYQDFNWSYYFTVLNTSTGSDNNAFGPRLGPNNTPVSSYSHTGGSIPSFGSLRAYDFTLNTDGATITRTDAAATLPSPPNTVEWNIFGNLIVGAGSTLNFDPSTAPLNLSGDLIIDPSGSFTFQNPVGRIRAGGDIISTSPTSFQTNAEVVLTSSSDQTIAGSTYRALVVQGQGTKTLTSDAQITSSLVLNAGTLVTGANNVILSEEATFSETNGYLLGNVETSRTLTAQSAEDFGGIGLTITPNSGSDVTVQRITGGFGVNGSPTDPRVTKTIRRRFFITSNNAQPTTGTLEFDYRTNNPNELEGNDPSTLKLYRSTDRSASYAVVAPGTNQNTPNTSPNTNTLTFEGPLALNSSYYSLSSDNVPLPVELISFTGKAENNAVRLNWATASELQNKGFEIQRRTNAGEWKSIGFVAGNGTTNQRHDYTYLDRLALAGINNYYRLRQVDLDGKSVYSQPVTVQLRGTSAVAFSVSPVPTTDVLTLNGLSAGKHIVEVYNARGQRVMSKEIAESASFKFSVRALPVGVYMVRVLGANRGVQNARFIKQ